MWLKSIIYNLYRVNCCFVFLFVNFVLLSCKCESRKCYKGPDRDIKVIGLIAGFLKVSQTCNVSDKTMIWCKVAYSKVIVTSYRIVL